ncbi:MAG: hypothetical protein OHK0045_01630 [Raineya sp.]
MKKTFSVLFIGFIISFGTFAQKYYGEKINESGAIAVSQLPSLMKDKEKLEAKLTGKIEEVCQKKGCWMQLDLGNGQKMRVKFKDYAFFVPKNAGGKTVVMEGIATKEVIDVATLRHYAEDAGKSKKEIEKITQAKEEISFEAKGVIIK